MGGGRQLQTVSIIYSMSVKATELPLGPRKRFIAMSHPKSLLFSSIDSRNTLHIKNMFIDPGKHCRSWRFNLVFWYFVDLLKAR